LDSEQGNGYSRMLIKEMIDHVENEQYMDGTQLLFIDMDASNGFWDYIGMKQNRYGLDYKGKRDVIGRGYEKVISWNELKRFIIKC
jgi:hypothetical protein